MALNRVSKFFGLPIIATDAVVKPEASVGHYVLEGTTGAFQAPKARLLYLQSEENELILAWRIETDLYDDWILSYINAGDASKILNVVNYVADASYRV